MRFRRMNPVYRYADYGNATVYDGDAASYSGVVSKTAILLGIIATVAFYANIRLQAFGFNNGLIITLIIAPIIAIIAVIVAHRRPEVAMFASIVYALMEGLFIGVISTIYAIYFGDQIVQMAVLSTFGVLFGMLFLYSTGIIRVGAFFRRLMFSLLIGLLFTSIIMMIVFLLAGSFIGGFESIYFAVVVISVVVSSLYLLIDFDNITKFVEAGAPKNMEWSLALGLVVTIVWLYIELLRLFAIIMDRR